MARRVSMRAFRSATLVYLISIIMYLENSEKNAGHRCQADRLCQPQAVFTYPSDT